MMDGAIIGIGPERALKTILGGEPSPAEDEQMAFDKFRNWILAAPKKADTYDDAGRCCARIIYDHLKEHPEDANLSGHKLNARFSRSRKKAIDNLGLSGFLWGWGENAARRLMELHPVPNPAIITIEL